MKTQILLPAYLYLWAMTVFMIKLATPPVLLILSDADSSSRRILIITDKTAALVDLRRRS